MKYLKSLLFVLTLFCGGLYATPTYAQADCSVPGTVAPCTLNVTVTSLPYAVTLAWDASPTTQQVTSYKVYDGTALLGTASTATLRVNLPTVGTHVLTVTAVNAAAESPKSPAITASVRNLQAPSTPTNLRIVVP